MTPTDDDRRRPKTRSNLGSRLKRTIGTPHSESLGPLAATDGSRGMAGAAYDRRWGCGERQREWRGASTASWLAEQQPPMALAKSSLAQRSRRLAEDPQVVEAALHQMGRRRRLVAL